MFSGFTRPIYQVSVYRTIGPLVLTRIPNSLEATCRFPLVRPLVSYHESSFYHKPIRHQ